MTADEEILQQHRIDVTTVMAKAVCAYYGPKPGCICKGVARDCIAVNLYGEEVAAAFRGIERAGYMVLSMPPPPSVPRMEETVAAALDAVEEALVGPPDQV